MENCSAICSPAADTETAARLLLLWKNWLEDGKTSPLDLNHFCSLRKQTLLGETIEEYKMYRKIFTRLDKLNSVTDYL